jgi:replicative DNA helicase
VPTIAHVDYYCKLVKEKWLLRELQTHSIETITNINNPTLDIEDVLDIAERGTLAITERRVSGAMRPTSAIVPAITGWMRDLRDNPRDVTGLPTGFTEIDSLMRGMQKQDLIIIAGRPSMGKSSLAINIAQNAAIREGASVAIFSLEMGEQQIVTRMICSEADTQDITLGGLQTGRYSSMVVPPIEDAAAIIAKAKIYIDESNGISSMAIRAKSRLLKTRNGLDLIIIDYLQLMEEKRGRNDNREQEIATISRRLKALAKELDIPVVALSQLNRAAERREIERPRLADLRESGAIEQDADVVLMLYREEYYYRLRNPTAERMPEDMRNMAEVIIAKQRNGPIGVVKLNFFGERVRFENIDNVPF